ncbi:response regulator transcription factor [Cyanobium sp. Morenito 9A2]|uniref:response regulator transcription factor n=1 Tax=Cyanobium sp. Morenito 9A2 TaxID=2823718 RepID=UPI0020CC517E|nr:response regulator [Cyanobium sp. Morenito 9A2]MCP9848795.1 response regulator [Cyanobium sp. Morenito 9A2]
MSCCTQAKIHVAIVDDDPRLRDLLALELMDLGCTTEVYGSAEALLECAETARFELVLLDLVMPGLDGLAALKRLRGRGHQGRIVIISSLWTLGRWQQLMAGGANDYIVKTSLIAQLPDLLAALRPCPESKPALQSA